jgi:hypothetical protein
MTEPTAPPVGTSPLPSPSANGSAPPAPGAPARGRTRTKISGMRAGLIAGTARITRLRRIMRRSRRQPAK